MTSKFAIVIGINENTNISIMAFFGRNQATANPLSRRLFFWALACSFFITTSIVIFFSLGYRYAFIEDIFLHTGSINFKSEPRNVSITVDGKKPPARHLNVINNSRHITGLRYGMHTVEATAPGHKPWSKEIRIRSGIATEFWNVILIKDTYERRDHSVINPKKLFFTPRNELLAYPQIDAEDSSLYIPILDIKSDAVLETHKIPFAQFTKNAKENIEWSPNIRFLATPILRKASLAHEEISLEPTKENISFSAATRAPVEDSFVRTPLEKEVKDYAILDRDRFNKQTRDGEKDAEKTMYLSTLISKLNTDLRNEKITQQIENQIPPEDIDTDAVLDLTQKPRMLRWHPKRDNAFLTLLGTDLLLFQIDSETNKGEIFAKNVAAYDFADDGIYITTTDNRLLWGRTFDPTNTQTLLPKVGFSENPQVRMIAYDNSRILLIDDAVGSLQIYNAFEEELVLKEVLNTGLKGVQFSDDGKKFMFHTANSVSVYYTREWIAQPQRETNTMQRILETEGEITATEWTSDYEHFIAALGKELYIAEIDDRSEYRVEKFLEREVVDENIIIDQQDNKLYFTEKSDDGTINIQSITFPYEKPGLF